MTATAEPEFETLLEHLKRSRGSDFTGYKRSTLVRRFRKRMDDVGAATYPDYAAYLDAHPDEFTALFNTILINVTSFFRDPEAWEALAREVLAPLAARKPAGEPIRVWSAGCASGEETYTVVMALAEVLGIADFRARVKVYATDVDDEALAQARHAVYPAAAVDAVPEPLREKYFQAAGGQCVFRPDLRRLVIFGRHDLARDAPISHLDLLVSRNTLMYFNPDVQGRILNRFHFALDHEGALFLGKAEMMRTRGALFAPLNLKARLFTRVHRTPQRERRLTAHASDDAGGAQARQELRLRQAALDAEPSAQVVVSPAGTVLLANAPARALFGLAPGDVGKPLQELTLSYRPVELRARVEQVLSERRPVRVEKVEHAPAAGGELRVYEVHVTPLLEGKTLLGVSIAFVDVTAADRLRAEVQEARQEMETAYEELQSANEELETTNEELQSTNEELETTNEELQSTNEELETMNEELQSTNEELETINHELAQRSADVDVLNAYLGSVLASVRVAVVVVDAQSDIRVWSRRAEELWGLREEEVLGQAFQNLEIGLPVERLKAAVRACVEGRSDAEEVVLDAVNRRGRAIGCRVTVAPLRVSGRDQAGAVLVMEEQPAPGEPAP
jgi:two-component system CheB/CheR fusion protein